MIEQVSAGGKLLAIILREGFNAPGIHFLTPGEFSQQLAYMRHPAGKVIDPHIHNPVRREVSLTQEVLLVRRGRVRVDFYDDDRNYVESRVLSYGDTILLASGGHGFLALEELEMIEVKQGPFTGDGDKTRFQGITADQTIIAES